MPARRTKSPYSVHPSVAMVQQWTAQMPAKTGRSLDEWVALVAAQRFPDAKAERQWLKGEHGLGTNTAGFIVERGRAGGTWDGDPVSYLKAAVEYVDAMFAGGKAAMRSVYDELLAVCLAVGPAAKACPCRTIVPIYRTHVFAEIKPSTRTRIDLGFSLPADVPFTDRLRDTGGLKKKDRITHRLGIASAADINAEVRHWLTVAYQRDG